MRRVYSSGEFTEAKDEDEEMIAEASSLGWPPPSGPAWAPPFVIVVDGVEFLFTERIDVGGDIVEWRYCSDSGRQVVVINDWQRRRRG